LFISWYCLYIAFALEIEGYTKYKSKHMPLLEYRGKKPNNGKQYLIISGKDKGRKGKVIESLPKESRVVVENINLRKKHSRAKKSGEKGQIVELPMPLNASSVKVLCPKCGKAVRVGYRIEGKKKHRICKKCGRICIASSRRSRTCDCGHAVK